MINQILTIVFQASPGSICGMCMEKMLTPDNERSNRYQRILFWSLNWVIIACVRGMFPSKVVLYLMNIMFFLFTSVILRYCYTDKNWRKWSAIVLLFFTLTIIDLLYSVVINFYTGGKYLSLDFSQESFVWGSLFVSLLSMLCYIIECEIWCRVAKKGRILSHLFLFVAFCISEVVTLFLFYRKGYKKGWDLTIDGALMFAIIFLTVFAATVIMFNQSEKKEIEEELREVRHVSELEQVHYQEIEKRREEMAKIRHDYNNILSSVLFLLNTGKTDESRQMLSELSDRIENTKEYPYCGIPIINAVLSEKEKLCQQSGIILRTELLLPDVLSISNLDLCSALGNLLDNAIRACKKMELEEKPEIRLSCGIVGGYLVVKSVNPSAKAPGEKPEGTGYGLRILNDLAKRYRGDFFTEYKDGIFIAQLSLQMENSEKTKLV